ncbi:DUF1990 domain-containing protein [Planosporangium flavigriseum]|uniref:DUF1990 domain-containing protein n=1 Tax=Planosporangium flavigriseum TaxID=373681 RepID=A0A8J3PQ64_9ACTN|nr:DUF1990 domain-containing protein [Planosporangium flavigriseum]NJC67669.1 DUF1990 domain-containing protein [Planosporangium flavigriseum]GIG75761.1 hypothetical protein Pfl04_41650 [Planosporangium flavigriseum]
MRLPYPEVGATRGDRLPEGYRHVRRHERLGAGVDVFRRAVDGLRGWHLQRGAGLRVPEPTQAVAVGVRVTMSLLFLRIPCQVVWVVDSDRRYGYGYGTLPGHPEVGEEAFEVHLDAADQVWLSIRAFSRAGRWYTRLAGPLGWLVQDLATRRYVAALRRIARGPSS